MTDDNKTTPTPAPGLDLDAVERATSGRGIAHANAAHRHAPALIAEVRALRGALAEAKRIIADLSEWLPHGRDVECADEAESLADVKRRLAALEAL